MMYYDTWNQRHQEDLLHIKFCGQVALKQMQLGRFFLREQPTGTWIDQIPPWTIVIAHESVVTQTMDQCMTGAKDEWNQPVKKPIEWTANSETLLHQCDDTSATALIYTQILEEPHLKDSNFTHGSYAIL